MFNIKLFSEILQKIANSYDSISDFSGKSEVNRTYLSKYINQKLNNPPSPKILLKIANASNNIITYDELMNMCGYQFSVSSTLENETFSMFQSLITEYNSIDNLKDIINTFQKYIEHLSILLSTHYGDLFLASFVSNQLDCIFFMTFHDTLLKYLISNELIDFSSTCSYIFVNWFDKLEAFENSENNKDCLLFCPGNKNFNLKRNNKQIINIAKKFITYIKFSYLINFTNESNDFLDIFKSKVQVKLNNENAREVTADDWNDESKYIKEANPDGSISYKSKFYMCPVYGQISAGQPNWAEECIIGYIPLDIELMNIHNHEECFFLKVNR